MIVMKIYNAEGQILGRLSSVVAKDILNDEKVIVVNCEKAVISGNKKSIEDHYKTRVERGDAIHGPFFPRTPDGIFRRSVRGMIPWQKRKGRRAFKKLKVFIGVPKDLEGENLEKVKVADASKLRVKYLTLEKLSISLGAKKRW